MRIGIIGSGRMGMTAARLFVAQKHMVAIANTRGPNSLPGLGAQLDGRARAATVREVTVGGQLILLALPFGRHRELPAEMFVGKLVVDATNYEPARDGSFVELDAGRITSSELIAQHLAAARVVKALGTMNHERLAAGGRTDLPREERLALLLAGDDQEAKDVVAELIEQLGFAALDTGSLARGGRLGQPGSSLYDVALHPSEAQAALVRAADETIDPI